MAHYEGKFNWQGEIHDFKREAVSYAQAFRHMTHDLSRKLGIQGRTVRNYFLSEGTTDDSLKTGRRHEIIKK